MKTKIVHGAQIETATPAEIEAMLHAMRMRDRPVRIRAVEDVPLDVNGNGGADVYNCPVGYTFEARRVLVTSDGIADPFGAAAVTPVAGKWIEYRRSGTLIEYSGTMYGGRAQLPGVQSWGAEQGPYFQNGEVFQVAVFGLVPLPSIRVQLEGILSRPQGGN